MSLPLRLYVNVKGIKEKPPFSLGAHYIYTTPSVQYKRLFELAPAQINQRSAAYEWSFCCIDRNRRSGQDTGGFALAVGRLAVSRAPLKTGRRQYKVMRSAGAARSLHTVKRYDSSVTTDERSQHFAAWNHRVYRPAFLEVPL